jgi:Protein of unknown function (DUF2510)/Phospholipase_D-nuclease N-terminal
MTGQIAGPSLFSLELVALIVGLATIAGAVDLIRQPGWAWKRAEESKAAYLILVVLVPIVGLSLYVFKGRPKVATIAAAGKAASLPFERFGEQTHAGAQRDEHWPVGAVAAPVGFDVFNRANGHRGEADPVGPLTESAPVEVSGTFFSSGGTATKTRPPVGLSRTYRPKQRTSLAVVGDPVSTVPAGWKADPTGRHQFRYWDGFHWTENVADAGEQSRDAVAS